MEARLAARAVELHAELVRENSRLEGVLLPSRAANPSHIPDSLLWHALSEMLAERQVWPLPGVLNHGLGVVGSSNSEGL
eukprot:SAG11_NODE_32923_length_280_cov_0.569061_1_plen_78_part_01